MYLLNICIQMTRQGAICQYTYPVQSWKVVLTWLSKETGGRGNFMAKKDNFIAWQWYFFPSYWSNWTHSPACNFLVRIYWGFFWSVPMYPILTILTILTHCWKSLGTPATALWVKLCWKVVIGGFFSISIISDKIFGDCLLSSFTFDIYSGQVEHSQLQQKDLQ